MDDIRSSQPCDRELVHAALAIARRFASGPDAEDLAQTALMRFLLVEETIDNPVAWLRVVIRRLAGRTRSLGAQEIPLTPENSSSIDPRRRLDLEIDVRWLLDLLPARGQDCIRLVLLGHTAPEIAIDLACSVKTVEKAIENGRRHLRRLYWQRGGSPVGCQAAMDRYVW